MSNDDARFRTAELADIPALVPLIESAYRGESSRAGWTTEADLLEGRRTDAESVAAVITRDGSMMLVVEREDRIVACCQLEHRGGTAYFGMFSVRPELQGAGLGRTVLARAETFAREVWGVGEMEMTVIVQRADLIAWYERRGFTRTGEYSPFPYGNDRVGTPLRDDLRFERLTKKL
ncbi:GNAT family N-acetyltransferase [Streptacidiphilus rugosus]|uniref:GNAT family N-acetyltransferase n=1 Tax=Streptacidiphilus rugosus TaxID=405783 RepID=UPI00056CDEA4|nr:GNAT family N-acetyltransferase [Streptacidiphilus rugosus]